MQVVLWGKRPLRKALKLGLIGCLGGIAVALYLATVLFPLISPALSVKIDPGHGGTDPGAVGNSGLLEKTVTLEIAQEVTKYLRAAGMQASMTRTDDSRLESHQRSDLLARVRAASSAQVDIMVSIHVNSFGNKQVRGPRTYYQPGSASGQRLASCVQQRLRAAAGRGNRTPTAEDHLVTRATPMTAIIVEVGYISNPTDEKLLATPAYRGKMAAAIAQGVLDCYPRR